MVDGQDNKKRGEAGKESDIDLFIETTNKKIEKKIKGMQEKFYESVKYKEYWELMGITNPFNCIAGNLDAWDDLKSSIRAQGITLYGKWIGKAETEPYYLFTLKMSKNRNQNISLWRSLYGYTQKINKKVYEKQGKVKEYTGEKLARGVFIIPGDHTQKMIEFLKKKKCSYTFIPFLKEKN